MFCLETYKRELESPVDRIVRIVGCVVEVDAATIGECFGVGRCGEAFFSTEFDYFNRCFQIIFFIHQFL